MVSRPILALLATSLSACALIASIDDITVVGPDDGDDASSPDTGSPFDSGNPNPPDGNAPDGKVPGDGGSNCSTTKAFGAPIAIAELNSASNDISASLSQDELTVFLASDRAGHIGGGSIYSASRGSRGAAFGAPALVANVNNAANATVNPSVTGDTLQLFVQITLSGGTPHIYSATRGTPTATFNVPIEVANVNSGASDFLPFVANDGSALYFASNRTVATEFVLYQSIATDGVFGAPTVIPGIATGANPSADTSVVMSADKLTLYFASQRDDSVYHVYVARRASATDTFAGPTPVSELNSPIGSGIADLPNWLSPDGCRMYMTRGAATGDVYLATRTP